MTLVKIEHTFNLPEDNSDMNILMNAHDYYAQLSDLADKLREKIKYGELNDADYETYTNLRRMIDLKDII